MDFDALILRGYTAPVNLTFGGAGNAIVKAIDPGKKFVVFYLHLEASASVDLIFKSEGTEMTGVIAITASQVYDFEASGMPILKGTATGDDFIINASGACDVDGWAYMGEIDQ